MRNSCPMELTEAGIQLASLVEAPLIVFLEYLLPSFSEIVLRVFQLVGLKHQKVIQQEIYSEC